MSAGNFRAAFRTKTDSEIKIITLILTSVNFRVLEDSSLLKIKIFSPISKIV